MKVSFGSWAFTFGPYASHPIPFDEVAARLASAGYDGVEVSGFPPHVTLEAYPDTESRVALRRRLEDLNLGISGYAADFTLVNPSVAGNKDRYLYLFAHAVDLCREIGSPSIRVDTGTAPGIIPDDETEDTLHRLAETWRACAEFARTAGVAMDWEFEPAFAFNKPSEVVRLHDLVAHPNFRILFDTAHAYMCGFEGARQHGRGEKLEGGVAQFLDLCQGRIGHVHLADSDGTLLGDETSSHCSFGEGKIPFFKVAPKLRAVKSAWWCVDLCFHPKSWDQIDPALKFVRSLSRASA